MDTPHEISTILISPHVYSVVVRENLVADSDALGLTGTDRQEIFLDADMGPTVSREVLLHEAMHGIWSQTELDRKYKDSDEEAVCFSLAPRLLALLRENPELVTYLCAR